MDNLNIHRRKSLIDNLGAEIGTEIWSAGSPSTTLPKHSSWLNQAEIEIGLLARQCLGSRRIPDLATLRHECRAWNRQVNRQRLTINWQFNFQMARRKFDYKRNVSKRSSH